METDIRAPVETLLIRFVEGDNQMLLRRITEHVKAQNWTAVVLDFVIVVVGVFIGIQVANWNGARQERFSETQYLERFADEIALTIAHVQEEHAFSQTSLEVIEAFAIELNRGTSSDDELVTATNTYFSEGTFFANFRPHRATFDDLVSTGNFEIIGDEAIRTGLVRLYARYDHAHEVIQSNIDWIQQGEDTIYYGFDAFRFDARTQILFEGVGPKALAADVRDNEELLRRHAAFHYWLKIRSIELYDEIEPQAQTVLALIKAKVGG